MQKHSFITDLPWAGLESKLKLHADQLVCDVLAIMSAHNFEVLPVYNEKRCIGLVYREDLNSFISTPDYFHSLLFHRLNFDLKSAILNIMNNR